MSTTETTPANQLASDALQQTHLGIHRGSGLRERRASSFRTNRSNALAAFTTLSTPTPGDGSGTSGNVLKSDDSAVEEDGSFLSFYCAGWADGTPGTILPHLEEYYGLSHFTVSLIFIATATGFGVGTIINEPLFIALGKFSVGATKRTFLPPLSIPFLKTSNDAGMYGHSISQGRCLTLLVGGLSQIIYFSIASSKPPFIGLTFAFFFGGVSIAIISAQCNAYVAGASVRTQGRALGNLHGFYGIGAFASPLVCQTALAAGWKWNQFYYTSIGFSLSSFILLIIAFHTTSSEFEIEKDISTQLAIAQEKNENQDSGTNAPEGPESIRMDTMGESSSRGRQLRRRPSEGNMPKNTMRAALSHRYVWMFMIFLLFYTGSETTTGGWIVTYLLKERSANPNTVGYVASGFWGGLALGRIILGHASPYIGLRKEKHLVHVYIAISLVMTVIIWFVPSFIGNAICAAFIGFLLGPIFPTSLALATKILPKEVHLTALSVMSSFAAIGSAVFPFIAGVLANAKGVVTLQPFMMGILGMMGCLWFLFPSRVGMTV
ncbi:hypothetical protein FRC03_000120 [Tulasnella sp. 419]|nr:hypothetical protein FRC03_000120 [Tulasnella sp. 419]